MFKLFFEEKFLRKAKKISKNNPKLSLQIKYVIAKLEINPKDPELKTHKVLDIDNNPAFSSKINGDLRIIWDYRKNEINIIDILDIGGHSGGNKVYK